MLQNMFKHIDTITGGLASQVLKSHPRSKSALLLLDDYVLIAYSAATDADVSRAYVNYVALLKSQHRIYGERYRKEPSQLNRLRLDASVRGLREESWFFKRTDKVIRIDGLMGHIHQGEVRFEDILDPETARAVDTVYDIVLAWLAKEEQK